MPLTRQQKRALAERNVATENEVAQRLDKWMGESGWHELDIARAIGYSRTTVGMFRSGRYCENYPNENNSLALCAALADLMDAHPTTYERAAVGNVYRTNTYHKLRRVFFDALDQGSAYCVDGAPGTQKTFMLQALCGELDLAEAGKNGRGRRAVYARCRPEIKPKDLMQRICMAAGISTLGNIDILLRKVRAHFGSRRVLLVLDEAQHLSTLALETLRELLDEPPYFGLLFAGSHDLQNKFNDLRMEQWHSRLQAVVTLDGLTMDEARQIIAAELPQISARKDKQDRLIEQAMTRDFRKTADKAEYLSARNLFYAIRQIQAKTSTSALAEGATA